MGVRLYNPTTGRFLTTDPVEGGSAGPYLYPTDPIDGFDLTGQCWSWCNHVWHHFRHFVSKHWRGMAQVGVFGACIVVSVGACAGLGVAAAFATNARWSRHGHYRGMNWTGFGIDAGLALVGWAAGRRAERYLHGVYSSGVPRSVRHITNYLMGAHLSSFGYLGHRFAE